MRSSIGSSVRVETAKQHDRRTAAGAVTLSTIALAVTLCAARLRELGWVEGGNLAIAYRWADGNLGRYAAIAAELVESKPRPLTASRRRHLRRSA